MTPDEIREDLELKIVEFIKDALESGKLTEERSQIISEQVLTILKPGMSMDELYRAIPKLDDLCSEISPVIIPYLRDYEENITKHAQETVSELIRQGQYDTAVKVANKAINQDVNLEWRKTASASPSDKKVT